MASVVLVGGPGGAGSTSETVRLARAAQEAGADVRVLDLDAWNGVRSADPSLPVLDPPSGVVPELAELIDLVGLDARLPEELLHLPGISLARSLSAVGAAGRLPGPLLVDCGAALIDLLELADRLPWVVRAVQPAHQGWLRTARPVTALAGAGWPAAQGASAMRRVGSAVCTWRDQLSTAVVVLRGAPEDPRRRRFEVAARLFGLVVAADEPEPWRLARDAADPLPEGPVPLARAGELSPVDAGAGQGAPRDGSWHFRMPIGPASASELSLARGQDAVMLEVLGMRRILGLPNTLDRHRISSASVRDGMLGLRFDPIEQEATRP